MNKHNWSFSRCLLIGTTLLTICNVASAIPEFSRHQVVTIGNDNYIFIRDSDNENLFYEVPNHIDFSRNANDEPEFYMTHFGLSAPDPTQIGGNMTMKAVVSVKNEGREEARNIIRTTYPAATFPTLAINESYYDLLFSGNFISGPEYDLRREVKLVTVQQDPGGSQIGMRETEGTDITDMQGAVLVVTPNLAERVIGGPIGSPQSFTIDLNDLGVRATGLSDQQVNPEALFAESSSDIGTNRTSIKTMAIRYLYKVIGSGVPYHATVTAHFKRIASYLQQNSSSSKWFGIKRSASTKITQDLKDSGAIEVVIHNAADLTVNQNAQAEVDAVVTTISNALINGTGIFSPVFKVSPGGGGGGGFLGWASRSSSYLNELDDDRSFTVEFKRFPTVSKWYQIGTVVGEDCDTYPSHYQNITEPGKNCLSAGDLDKFVKASNKCLNDTSAEFLKQAAGVKDVPTLDGLEKFFAHRCLRKLASY